MFSHKSLWKFGSQEALSAVHRWSTGPFSTSWASQEEMQGSGIATAVCSCCPGLSDQLLLSWSFILNCPLGNMQHMFLGQNVLAAWVKQNKEMSHCMVVILNMPVHIWTPIWRNTLNLTTDLSLSPAPFNEYFVGLSCRRRNTSCSTAVRLGPAGQKSFPCFSFWYLGTSCGWLSGRETDF